MFAPKLFYEVNDIEFNWKKIRGDPPRANYVAHDRNLTTEEIRKLMAYPDRRVKVIVLILYHQVFESVLLIIEVEACNTNRK